MYEAFPVSAVPEGERFGYFQSVVDSVFCPMQVQRSGNADEQFRGTVEAASLGAVRLARVSASALAVRRRSAHVARLADAPYLVKFQMKGEALWSQRGRDVHLKPGDFVIASMAEPYVLQFRGAIDMPVLALSPGAMRGLTPDPDQFLGQRMCGDDADCGLLSSFVAQVISRISRLREPMISKVEANILDLLGGVLSARAVVGAVSASQQLTQMRMYIDQHLHDRRLGPAMLARAFSVSTRYVHTLFESQPQSVGRYIRSLRVSASRRMLEEQRGRSLTDIALDCGFYDLSHMTRCFRAEFGQAPRDYRATLDGAREASPSPARGDLRPA